MMRFNTILVTLLFLIPNVVLVISGFQGFYLTYSLLSILIVISLPTITTFRGSGALDSYSSFTAALLLISTHFILGFIWGFGARPVPMPMSFVISLTLFLVNVLCVEVARAIVVSELRGVSKVVAGVVIGLVIGNTIPAIINYFDRVISTPLPILKDSIYSYLITLIQVNGGFMPALVFRLVVDGFWRFSPLVLDTSRLGVMWHAISALTYYCVIVYLFYLTPRLKGYSKAVFRPRRLLRLFEKVATVATYVMAMLILLLAYQRVVPMVIVSGSMSPTLDVGDIVLVDARRPISVSVGDMVAFRFENSIVIHRVIEIFEEGFRTKGDANINPDPFIVTYREVLGKVILAIPKVGIVSVLLHQGLNVVQADLIILSMLATAITVASIMVWTRLRRIGKARIRRSSFKWM